MRKATYTEKAVEKTYHSLTQKGHKLEVYVNRTTGLFVLYCVTCRGRGTIPAIGLPVTALDLALRMPTCPGQVGDCCIL